MWVRAVVDEVCGSCGQVIAAGAVARRVKSTRGLRCPSCAYVTWPYEPQPPDWYVDTVSIPNYERPWLKWTVQEREWYR
jgi:hypothetical protein